MYSRADRVSLDPILQVSFAEAVMGATKEMMAKTPELCESCKAIKPFVDGCKLCKTKGFHTVNRSVQVNVPPGAVDGQKVTVNLNNKLLTVELKVTPDDYYSLSGNDLSVTLPITIVQWWRGGQINFRYVDGTEKTVEISPYVTSVLMPGLGIKNGRACGDLHVSLAIEPPGRPDRVLAEMIACVYDTDVEVARLAMNELEKYFKSKFPATGQSGKDDDDDLRQLH